jgi:hypothetical protein
MATNIAFRILMISVLNFGLGISIKLCGQKTFIPDTTLNNEIILMNVRSILNHLGDVSSYRFEDDDLPRVCFIDSSKSFYIILTKLPGGNANRFMFFEVGYLENGASNLCLNRNSYFNFLSTESGIKLGISFSDFKLIKGANYRKSMSGNLMKISFRIDSKNDTYGILKKYNMPIYEANYYFQKGKLIRYSFGFPYL